MAFPRQLLLFIETVSHKSYETVEGNLNDSAVLGSINEYLKTGINKSCQKTTTREYESV